MSDPNTPPRFDEPVRLLVVQACDVDCSALRRGALAVAEASGVEVEMLDLPRALELPTLIAMAERQASFDGYVVLGCTTQGQAIAQSLALVGLQGAAIGSALVATPAEATAETGRQACLAALHLIAISRKWAGQTKGIGFRP